MIQTFSTTYKKSFQLKQNGEWFGILWRRYKPDINSNIEITKLVENFVCDDPTVSGLEGCFGVFSNFPFIVKY